MGGTGGCDARGRPAPRAGAPAHELSGRASRRGRGGTAAEARPAKPWPPPAHPHPVRQGIAYLSNVAVCPSVRRRGIARRLMAEAEATAAEWGFRAVSLHCDPANAAAWQLYRRLGYRRVALEAPWAPYLNGRAPNRCYLMLKRLPPALVRAAAERREAREVAGRRAAGGDAAAAGRSGGEEAFAP